MSNAEQIKEWLKAGMRLQAVAELSGMGQREIVELLNDGKEPLRPATTHPDIEARNLELVRRFEAGERLNDIGAAFHMTGSYVSQICTRYGASKDLHRANSVNHRRGSRSPERDAEMCEMYLSGKTLEECGQHYAITRERVRQILNRAGIQERYNGFFTAKRTEARQRTVARKTLMDDRREGRKAERATARMMYDDNYTYAQIAEELGHSIAWVQQAIWQTGGPDKNPNAGKPKRKLTLEEKHEIGRLYAANEHIGIIAARYDICPAYIGNLSTSLGYHRPGYGPGITACNKGKHWRTVKRENEIVASEPAE